VGVGWGSIQGVVVVSVVALCLLLDSVKGPVRWQGGLAMPGAPRVHGRMLRLCRGVTVSVVARVARVYQGVSMAVYSSWVRVGGVVGVSCWIGRGLCVTASGCACAPL
jgi:hypothetical protein